MARISLVSCPISNAEEPVVDADLPEEQEDPELPRGWIQLTIERVVPNPEYATALQQAVEGYLQLVSQQVAASNKGKPLEITEKMRQEATAAIEDGQIAGIELPHKDMVVSVEEHFSVDAEPLLKQALGGLRLEALDAFFAAGGA